MRDGNLDRRQNNNAGAILLVVLAVVFIVLKLAPPVQEWSWWAVTAPLWIPIAIAAVIAIGKAVTS